VHRAVKTVGLILMKFGTMMHLGFLDPIREQNFRIFKIEMADGSYLENYKNDNISKTVCLIFMIFGMLTHIMI